LNKWLLVLLAALIFLSGGCGFKDIDKRYFVTVIGIDSSDKGENVYKVSLKISIPTTEPQKAGNNEFILLSEDAPTISEAVRKLKAHVDREIDFSHAKAIIFGKSIVQRDISPILDWFTRRTDIQHVAWVAVGNPTAKDILNLKVKGEQLSANALFLSFGDAGAESPYIVSKYLYSFRKELFDRGIDAILPEIRVSKQLYEIDRAWVFNDNRAVLRLTPNETKNLNVLTGNKSDYEIKVKSDNQYFILNAYKTTVHKKFMYRSGKPTMVLNIKIKSVVGESKQEMITSRFGQYEKIAEKQSEKRMMALLEKCQKAGVDPVGFGLKYYATHFDNQKKYDEWKAIYPNLAFQVNSETDIVSRGSIR
jgi:spore germination protein KC